MRSTKEVAQVLDILGNTVEQLGLNSWQLRTLYAIKKCRTSALGGHIDACDDCGNISISYNSCRNRHCPKCQGKNKEDWIQAREKELLPVPYFHVVFTLPETLNSLAIYQPKLVYDSLFAFGNNKGLQMGMIGVLHTWGQNLSLHPHLHCIVPGGGVNDKGVWENIRNDGKFLFPVKALSKVFRAKFCALLLSKAPEHYHNLKESLRGKPWVVYTKKPFGSPKSVVEYLGRYTHKIAISNHRLQKVDAKGVTFSYKDYKAQGIKKEMTLSLVEFTRRFALHILPKNFVKIRHYGFLSSTWKRHKLSALQAELQVKPTQKPPKTKVLPKCSCCKNGNLHTLAVFDRRGPPAWYLGTSQNTSSCKS
ncbi:IS91 family transposase [Flavobacterium oreochromis]|uniref:IS91 family transposase n=2 Tax=Flavobacterium oreochromis TaxID=2906078 RepID=A0ABW8PBH1_9FLAO|nr:IS91 family transposase [Flavobacterium oreochromis]OWP74107.1 IS91 family transposase [Flavobacterium oreochromis]